jgi:hypothetical protein
MSSPYSEYWVVITTYSIDIDRYPDLHTNIQSLEVYSLIIT